MTPIPVEYRGAKVVKRLDRPGAVRLMSACARFPRVVYYEPLKWAEPHPYDPPLWVYETPRDALQDWGIYVRPGSLYELWHCLYVPWSLDPSEARALREVWLPEVPFLPRGHRFAKRVMLLERVKAVYP